MQILGISVVAEEIQNPFLHLWREKSVAMMVTIIGASKKWRMHSFSLGQPTLKQYK